MMATLIILLEDPLQNRIFFRLMAKTAINLSLLIMEKTSTVCTLQPQKHARKRTKHHVIFPVTNDDILQEHLIASRKYRISSVVKHLLARNNQLITTGRCGNVISEAKLHDQYSSVTDVIESTTAMFCDGKKRITTSNW